jgi:hypothetical protein
LARNIQDLIALETFGSDFQTGFDGGYAAISQHNIDYSIQILNRIDQSTLA